MNLEWVDGFVIKTEINKNEIVIKANKEGLLSLANHLQKMAQDEILSGYHIHLDDSNSLEDESVSLIIQKLA
jgi:hypothetical protein